ncbi:nitroreductase family protein [Actinokineospora sp. NBRC 105648]|uniref:Acg family FMN-binding oxidoreductase n=1 Tax=Actinokineospora sp. NBRC 105648 TaxID=3032206 RepID=UPI00249FCE35|nr:nitroreductase family protein [Actinokineospora sp. NBRC 105648]GLZ36680.1 NAD(P)H nitroreductase [Actinokineospora sp. NBRC 105648]
MTDARRWTQAEVAVLAAAMSRAPSVHNSQPWLLELHGRSASVLERADIALPRHDPLGRDRLLSCGAAVTNLRLAVRRLGWTAPWSRFPDPVRPNEVARVRPGERLEPTDTELAAYRAIKSRHSHRAQFTAESLAPEVVRGLAHGVDVPGVSARVVDGAAAAELAHVLVHSASVLRHDRAYQRELAAWTAPGSGPASGDGLSPVAEHRSLPWAGLVDRHTPIPDDEVLTRRVAAETYLIVTTAGDGRGDHLHAGMAMEQIWLAATAACLAASVLTQPLHVAESRAGLIEHLELAGYPQALLRLGHPTETTTPSARRPLDDLVRTREQETTP